MDNSPRTYNLSLVIRKTSDKSQLPDQYSSKIVRFIQTRKAQETVVSKKKLREDDY